jgi:endonuclease I
MKKAAIRLVALIFPLLAMHSPATADVLISEMCDPRYNYLTDRFIEIYNSGTETVSLNGWSLTAVANSVDEFTWNLSGDILPGQALVCGDQTTVDVFQVDFAEEGWSDNTGNWNGKVGDGAILYNATHTLVDDTVVPGTTFENADLERNENISTPSASFNAAEWTAVAVNLPSEATPGTHHAPLPPVGPSIVNVTSNPEFPLAGDTVIISSMITDDAATITTVTLDWGLASGSLTNSIAMTLTATNTYTTANPIPGQSAGNTVFYTVSATNDALATTTSDELSFGLAWIVSIQDIQGTGLTSPHVGHDVITSGIVTAGSGGTWVIQDGTGTRSGLWLDGVTAPALGSDVTVQGLVEEVSGNTTLTGAVIRNTAAGSMPDPAVVTSNTAAGEDYEGVLVQLVDALCTVSDPGSHWYVNNGSSSIRVEEMWAPYTETLGSIYTVTGPVSGNSGFAGIVPRSSGDVVFVSDPTAPVITYTDAQGPTSVVVTFSETLNEVSAENTANYTVSGSSVIGAILLPSSPNMVELTVSYLTTGSHTLTVNGVADLAGNIVSGAISVFQFYGGNVPVGYYDPAIGLGGEDLRLALHNVIDGHNSVSYTYLWTAFYTTDDKADGTVWDMYSDIPGGTPPYVYEFGIDQVGSGATEGTGYNREHSWPQSWYGGSSPMYTDLFVLYPTDTRVNGYRGNYAYGEVSNPTITSWNGSKVGSNTYPGYTGTVFEPIDEYKGDFARAYFYMSVRYFTEDSSWDNLSPMSDRSQLLPWAEAMLLEWHTNDPVSQKEIDRNDDVYDIQYNRNPFIDRPDFVLRVFSPELTPVPDAEVLASIQLHQNVPNPFNPSTLISYELAEDGPVKLEIFDVAGRLVKVLAQEIQTQGSHQLNWYGRNQDGQMAATGVYFYRLTAEGESQTRRMLLVK